MPLFHFNLADHRPEQDHEGTELANVNEARVQAIIFAGSYLKDRPELLADGREFRVEVTDHNGSLIFIVAMHTITPIFAVADAI